jgi:hypothetical protein
VRFFAEINLEAQGDKASAKQKDGKHNGKNGAHGNAEYGSSHSVFFLVFFDVPYRQDSEQQGERSENEKDGEEPQIARSNRISGSSHWQQHSHCGIGMIGSFINRKYGGSAMWTGNSLFGYSFPAAAAIHKSLLN